ncbi:MAG TPA: tetratricopeptide repeat protein [Myxococcales bacterium]
MPVKPPKMEVGEAHEKKGDWAKAAEVYEQCVAASPDERVLLKLATVREKLG